MIIIFREYRLTMMFELQDSKFLCLFATLHALIVNGCKKSWNVQRGWFLEKLGRLKRSNSKVWESLGAKKPGHGKAPWHLDRPRTVPWRPALGWKVELEYDDGGREGGGGKIPVTWVEAVLSFWRPGRRRRCSVAAALRTRVEAIGGREPSTRYAEPGSPGHNNNSSYQAKQSKIWLSIQQS